MALDFSKKQIVKPDWLVLGRTKDGPTIVLTIASTELKAVNRLRRYRNIGYANLSIWQAHIARKETP
jgi:hypothetical protein